MPSLVTTSVTEFTAWGPRTAGERTVLDALPGALAAHQVRSVIEEVVAAEGPVQLDRLARLVAVAFGLSRSSSSRNAAIIEQVPRELLRADGLQVDDEQFAWPRDLVLTTWTAHRRAAPGTTRPLEQVSTREIANAMTVLVRASAGIAEGELFRATLAGLGRARLTPANRARLAAALRTAMEAGRVRVSPERLVTTA